MVSPAQHLARSLARYVAHWAAENSQRRAAMRGKALDDADVPVCRDKRLLRHVVVRYKSC